MRSMSALSFTCWASVLYVMSFLLLRCSIGDTQVGLSRAFSTIDAVDPALAVVVHETADADHIVDGEGDATHIHRLNRVVVGATARRDRETRLRLAVDEDRVTIQVGATAALEVDVVGTRRRTHP